MFLCIETLENSQKLQIDLINLNNYMNESCLKFNPEKCYIISFYKGQVINFSYVLTGVTLQRVTEIKDLGVIFDEKLSFSSHGLYN